MLRTPHVLYIFTSKSVFRHSGVQFFDIRPSKNAPNTSYFVHFHFQMCFSPKRRAIFRHLNVQKCSKHLMFCTFSCPHVLFATAACIFRRENSKKCFGADVFCTFSLQNGLFATAACIFSTGEQQKVLRT